MKKLLLLSMTVLCTLAAALAQRTISGTVTDENGEPLIGASVVAMGTTSGTITDIDGNFSFEVPNATTEVQISYIGYRTLTFDVSSASVLQVSMELDAIGLEEILVVGYSVQQKKDVTGAISSVKNEDFAGEAGLSLENALRGRAAGVQVFQASGSPGSAINVRVRGSSSINASNQPLYIIDGVPLISGNLSQVDIGGQDINALSDINPNDIESIEVLKDAASAAIYGNRAANGVVLITTKRGRTGATRINLDMSYGTQDAYNLVELMSPQQYRDQMEALFGNPDFLAGGAGGNTDWYDEIFHRGSLENYMISASGGDEKNRFYASLNYNDNQGILMGSQFERYSGRLNLDHDATDKLTLGVNMGYNYSKNRRIRNDNNIFGAVSVATLWPGTIPVRNEDGSFGGAFGWDNPVATATLYDHLVATSRMTGDASVKYEIVHGLSAKAKLGLDALDLREDVFEPSSLQSSNAGTARLSQTRDVRWLTEFTVEYQKVFGSTSLTALVGTGYGEDRIEQNYSQVDGFPTDEFTGLTSGATLSAISGDFSGDRLTSYFGNVNLAFSDKYIVTLIARADGSSRFINDKWGFFPGVSVAWRVSDEPFLKDGFFDQLKLRIGYGKNGNNSIGNFTSLQTYGGGNNYEDVPGITPTQLGNPDLSWEVTSQLNAGIDFAILDSRLGGSIDFYVKKTSDLLFNLPIPNTSGFTSVPRNIGDIENRGIEFSLDANPVRSRDLSWNLNFNASYNKNEILELFNGQPVDVGFATRLAEGHPIGAFFGHITDGIFQNQAEVEAHASQPNAAPGDIRFKDISGGPGPDGILGTSDDLAPDGVINDNDRTFIGQGLPDWTGGMTNTLSWKGLTLNVFLQFSLGNDIFNNNLAFSEGLHNVFNSTKRAWEGRWQQEGDDEDFPRAALGDPNNNTRNSTRFVEDGSFLRLKTGSLEYAIPTSVIEKAGLHSLKVSVTGTNLLTFTNYSWFDPEVSTFGEENVAPGTDFLTYPQARSVVFGVNVGF